MKRKVSLLCVITIIMQLVLSNIAVPSMAETTEPAKYTAPESPTEVYNMNIDWKYKRAVDGKTFPMASALDGVAKDGKQFYEVGYDDSDWDTVSVPHPINADDSFDGPGVDAGEGGLYRGFMFYRKNIAVPAEDAGKKFILEFEAVRQSVYLYVNGEMAGYYEAGITAMGFDITDKIKPGEENLIAVATDNMSMRGLTEYAGGTQETIPGHTPGDLSGSSFQWNTKDFNEVQGGITGNVILHAKNKVYQTLPLYNNLKTTGNYIYGTNFDLRENSADITVEAEIRNETTERKSLTLQVDIVDMKGNLIDTFSESGDIDQASDAGKSCLTTVPKTAYGADGVGVETGKADLTTVEVGKITATKNIKDLKFWSDKSPNLYTVYTILKEGDKVIDVESKVTGFRDVQYDKDKGLQINGETTYLKGYAQRATNEWAAIGVANDWLQDMDMQLIKESNANFIRWMHVAPKPSQIRSGDKYGVVSIAPAGDKEGDTAGRQWDQRLEAMRDVVIYYRNSPSVIFYEAGNNAVSAEHMKQMTDIRKALDPNGGRYMGCRTINQPDQIKEAEWVGTMLYRNDANAYASMQSTGNYIPMLETEYHRNEAPRRVWDDYSPPDYDYDNKWLGADGSKTDGFDVWDQTQEDFSRTMFNSGDGYSYYYNNRVTGTGKNTYSGAAMMVWSDSNMHVRNCGVENARTSGRVDPIRVKKESFYAIKAAQSDTPEIHILGHWNYPKYIKDDKENGNYWYHDKTFNGQYWVPNDTLLQRDPTKKTVYVIGSAGLSKVELYINDTLVGTDTTATDNFIYEFPNIDVTQSGKVSAKAYNDKDEVVAEHEIKTAGEAAKIQLSLVTGPEGLRADGSDLVYVDVSIVDEEGNVCPLDERKISFKINDTSKATFLGGYNSGVGDRIVNHKDYVFAECGINRVFVRSTRNAGEFTLTATAEGLLPETITIKSNETALTGGLTKASQQSFEQGVVPTPVPKEKASALKALGEVFTADFNAEIGNVVTVSEDEKDYYKVTVNGEEVTFVEKAYKPDSSTGVVGEVNPILAAIKAAGVDFEYRFVTDGSIPSYTGAYGELPYITIKSGEKTIDVINVATDIFVNGERNLSNFGTTTNKDKSALIAELSAVIGHIDGIKFNMDETNKTFNITTASAASAADAGLMEEENTEDTGSASLSYADGKITVTVGENITDAVLVMVGYDDNNAMSDVKFEKVNIESGKTSEFTVDVKIAEAKTAKAMLWDNTSYIKPLCKAVEITKEEPETTKNPGEEPETTKNPGEEPETTKNPGEEPETTKNPGEEPETTKNPGATQEPGTNKPDGIYKYDTIIMENDCNTDPDAEGIALSTDNAPDGTKYFINTSNEVKGGAGYPFASIGGNSTADMMWEADVRFDAEGSGITPYSKDNGKLGTCVRRHGDKLSIQTGSSSFTPYADIADGDWFHIVLIGRYSAPDAKTDMIIYKYVDGVKTYVDTFENVNQRNMSANNGSGADHINVHIGTGIDNVKVTKLGADKLTITADADEIKAGNTMSFEYGATRQEQYITKPAVVWSIYNADNTAEVSDENITINENGLLNVGLDAAAQTINVRATAESGVFASKEIKVNAVDISGVKFDTLTLSADKEYVSVDEPLTISVKATKGGSDVTLADTDLIWYVCDGENLTKLGDDLKWIKVDKGVLTVDKKAVSQDITVRAADPKDMVRGSFKVHIKSSDALENGEDGNKDILLTADSCETSKANTEFVTAPDGTHAYKATAGFSTANIPETNNDVVIEMDIKFDAEGAGFQPGNNKNNLNTCVIYHDSSLAIQTGGKNFTKLQEISSDKWYHITLIRKQGELGYAHMIFEEYDENGERINRNVYENLNQRNNVGMARVNINANTSYDNIRVLTPAPTDIEISTDAATVFAGNSIKAATQILWNGLEMKNPDASVFEYKIYDAEDKYPLENDKITVNGEGVISVDPTVDAQDVYVRAVAKQSGKYASAKFTVVSSDIFTMDKIGINEDGTKLVSLFVTKNFSYDKDVTFITQITDEKGNVKSISAKHIPYADSLKKGENKVLLGVNLTDFDKTKDTIKVFAITKMSLNDIAEESEDFVAAKDGAGIKLTKIPEFDAGAKIVVIALKAGSDALAVNDSDILYAAQVKASELTNMVIPVNESCIIETAGNLGGIFVVKTDSVE